MKNRSYKWLGYERYVRVSVNESVLSSCTCSIFLVYVVFRCYPLSAPESLWKWIGDSETEKVFISETAPAEGPWRLWSIREQEGNRKWWQILIEKLEGKRRFGRIRLRLGNNIKKGIKIVYYGVGWIYLAEESVLCPVQLNKHKVTNILDP
jgi:hypothetical protein